MAELPTPEPAESNLSEARAQTGLSNGNQPSPSTVLRALGLPRTGEVLDLTLAAGVAAPRIPGSNSPFVISMWSHPTVSEHNYVRRGATNGIAFADERIEFDSHTGTHIDALGHACRHDSMYGDRRVSDVVTNRGLTDLDSSKIPPLITRGLLIDAGPPGGALALGEAIDRRRLQGLAAEQGVLPEPGDIVLVRTGWARFYGSNNEQYVSGEPGITLDAAEWLAERGAVAVGADTMSVEVVPAERVEVPFPVHQYLLVDRGVYLIEQANLEELARLRIREFLCCCCPPKLTGATGSPLRLVAVL